MNTRRSRLRPRARPDGWLAHAASRAFADVGGSTDTGTAPGRRL